MGMLKAASLYMPHDVLLLIFYAFFYSQLHYGLLIWVNTYVSYLTPIKILYKRCSRLLSYENLYAHTPPLTLQLGLLILMICLLISQLSLCSELQIISCPHVYHVYFNAYMVQLAEILEIIFYQELDLKFVRNLSFLLGFKLDCDFLVTCYLILILELSKGPAIHFNLINM